MKKFNKISAAVLATACTLGFVLPLSVLAAGPAAVNLGSAGNFVILAKTGISSTGTTAIVGDIGVSPAEATYITGNFALDLPASSAFSTSALVTGKVYAPSYALPTPAYISTAVSDMETAYTSAAGMTNPTAIELGAGNISGMTLAPGLYKWGTGVTIPTDVTLSGSANDVWVFQVAQNLSVSSGAHIVLAGGAQASNIFWQVAGQTTIGTTAVFNGNILDQTAIVLNTGATLNGRALAQSAVTLDASSVFAPTASVQTAAVPATPATPATPAVPATPATSSTTGVAATPATSATPAVSATPATMTTVATHASGLSASKIQSILDVLASFNADASVIASVRASLGGTTTGSATSAAVQTFKSNLTIGSLGNEVKALQAFLNAHGYVVATTGAGSLGNETPKFGLATKAALAKYQQAKGITPAVGYFGAKTRAMVNAGE